MTQQHESLNRKIFDTDKGGFFVTTQVKTVSRERSHRTQRAFKLKPKNRLFFEFSALFCGQPEQLRFFYEKNDRFIDVSAPIIAFIGPDPWQRFFLLLLQGAGLCGKK
jgi:hypothetical protein